MLVSVGHGQGTKAETAVVEGRERGLWVVLQNCNLSALFMPAIERLIEEIDTAVVAEDFRLWLSSLSTPCFPTSVLEGSIKVIVEHPRGVKPNLLRTYLSLDERWCEEACS